MYLLGLAQDGAQEGSLKILWEKVIRRKHVQWHYGLLRDKSRYGCTKQNQRSCGQEQDTRTECYNGQDYAGAGVIEWRAAGTNTGHKDRVSKNPFMHV